DLEHPGRTGRVQVRRHRGDPPPGDADVGAPVDARNRVEDVSAGDQQIERRRGRGHRGTPSSASTGNCAEPTGAEIGGDRSAALSPHPTTNTRAAAATIFVRTVELEETIDIR